MLPKCNYPSQKSVTQEMVDAYVESLGGYDVDKTPGFKKRLCQAVKLGDNNIAGQKTAKLSNSLNEKKCEMDYSLVQGKRMPRKIIRLAKKFQEAKNCFKNEAEKHEKGLLREQLSNLTHELAWALLEGGWNEEALALSKELPTQSHDKYKCVVIGRALIQLKRYDEARAFLEKNFLKYRRSVCFLTCLGVCYHEMKLYDKALSCHEEALQQSPDDDIVLFNKAGVLHNMGCYEDARVIVEGLLKNKPRSHLYLGAMGYSYLMTGYPEDASKCFVKVISSRNANADMYNGLFWSYYDMDLRNDAISAAIEGLRRFPDEDAVLYHDLAYQYIDMDWMIEARDIVQKGLQKFPDDEDLKEMLDVIDEETNNPDRDGKPPMPLLLLLLVDKLKQGKRL